MYARVHVLYLLLQYLHVCMPGNSCMFARDLIEKCHTLQYGFGLLCAAFGKISLFKKTVLSCIHTHTYCMGMYYKFMPAYSTAIGTYSMCK